MSEIGGSFAEPPRIVEAGGRTARPMALKTLETQEDGRLDVSADIEFAPLRAPQSENRELRSPIRPRQD
jgi:hypothetical protein